MCIKCYKKDLKDRKAAAGAMWHAVPDVVMCKLCDDNKVVHSRNMCSKCYTKDAKDRKLAAGVMCKLCDDNKVVHLRNMCSKCYRKDLKGRDKTKAYPVTRSRASVGL